MQYVRFMILSILLLVIGCSTAPEVCVIRPWEGHFYNTNDFHRATGSIDLGKNESIWVISNKTLLKTLENAKK